MRPKSHRAWILLLASVLCTGGTAHAWEYPQSSLLSDDYDYGYADSSLEGYDGYDGQYQQNWASLTVSPECLTLEPGPQYPQNPPMDPGPQNGPPPMEPNGVVTPPPTTTTCLPPASSTVCEYPSQIPTPPARPAWQHEDVDESEERRKELRIMLQQLYVAEARVQLEATEIRKAQGVASSAQTQLEEATNQVRTITASLHTAQQSVAAAAIRAQIAQLQLAAHDQLLFAARQDVDALSSQMVGVQAAEGIVQPKLNVDLRALLDKLKQPLQQFDRPTPVPAIATDPQFFGFYHYQHQQPQPPPPPPPPPPQWQQPWQPPFQSGYLPNEMFEMSGEPRADSWDDDAWYDT
ncbi:mediator of RNA polymerase II transcription subunit 15 [Drosophila miranda]|uniref:mediator of RNA polymerase II transcription subunit 15 n=1 Tax=Drosophila miranda TaxID=7229 RepID=UPI0007E74872|nr:mediator of RNA polymerase II transcription subunit 15 [Drosophila miranda]